MEYVRKIQDSLKPHIEKVEAYLTSENPDPVAKGFQHISKLTHVKEIHLVYGKAKHTHLSHTDLTLQQDLSLSSCSLPFLTMPLPSSH